MTKLPMTKLSIVNYQLLIFLIALFFASPLKAQVNIGSNTNPHSFSILELTTSANNHGGLRLPQLTSDSISKLNTAGVDAAQGLVVYNTDTKCLEFWNGKEWISLCADRLDCSKLPALDGSSFSFCSNENATIADLTAKVGGNVQWRLSRGGSLLTDATSLTATTYYAYRNIPSCNISENGVPVMVTLANCTVAPVGAVTAFVNVMYDFQYQTLEAYRTSGGDATSWQWELSPNNINWTPIAGATSATYRIPENFIHNYSNYNAAPLVNDTVYFRCWMANPARPEGNYTASNLGIEFIRTTDGHGNSVGNYDKDENGVRYLTINRGGSLNGGKIKIMLLNLGQSGTGSLNQNPLYDDSRNLNDAGDLGDFYQWGRKADGHQQIVWSKQRSTTAVNDNNNTSPAPTYAFMSNWIGLRSGWGAGATSLSVARATMSVMGVVDANGGQATADGFVGNFITNNYDWGAQNTASNNRWGATTTAVTRSNTPTSINDWAFPTNNPCPTGWRVPSRFELWDIYNGDGSDIPPGNSVGYVTVKNGNTWRWRDNNSQAIGGAIISISTGEKVFLPAAGYRSASDGTLGDIGDIGYYWSSTYTDANYSSNLFFYNGYVYAGNTGPAPRANGFSIRCVKE